MSWELAIVDNNLDLEEEDQRAGFESYLDYDYVFFIYVFGSSVLVIFMFNLLISVISESFEETYKDHIFHDYKAKVEQIIAVHDMRSLRNKFNDT